MTTLFDYWRSSASYRVRIALALCGDEWSTEIVNLVEGAQGAPEHLARNPQGYVPALAIDEVTLTQSLAIIEYLDETRSLGLLPSSAIDRARVRAIAHAVAMDIHPICNLNVAKYAVQASGSAIETKDWMQHFISKGLRAVEQMVGDNGYCFGTRVTLADLCLMPQIYNAERWGVDMHAMPKLTSIAANLAAHPAFVAAHPDNCASAPQ
ncbi:maleylacetoacetate isomerase [Cognatishimia sp. SS12]|uniref:maleylacetoacetate isomerase n=1 Tax=Cognatishimia sp. SS12 TaxID=2979465 RepID=UPI00232EA7FB|nr:maleylacetoacetate isomerase [Cognatishimia sp. SS12]MDC0738485.1 maleylacetoacetate isomerase [Cognatishimia sp. SS12]